MDRISLVLPCFNEEKGVQALADRLGRVLQGVADRFGVEFDLVFVDDGSVDATVPMLRELEPPWPAQIIVLSRNFGKEAALTAGLDVAEGDAVIFMDSDLQHPPEKVEELIARWRDGFEVVYFYKRNRIEEGLSRRIFARLFYWLVNFGSRVSIPENAGDFRLMDRKVVHALRALPERARFLKGLYSWIGYRQVGIPYDAAGRHDGGKSRFSPIRIFSLAMDGLTSFSIAPIRMISIFGLLISLMSAVYLTWIVAERLILGSPFSGFASIVVLVVFFGGMQLLCLGILGEYIGKTLVEAKRRPTYIVRDRFDLNRRE